MKNKIAIASAFLAASSFSMGEIVINDFLSFEGFVDMSYSHTDVDSDFLGDGSDNSFQIDQVEIDWLFDFDPVTAQIDLQYEGDRDDDYDFDDDDDLVEQAFVTYHFDGDFEGTAVTAGRYASMLGFEAFEPTGLYQYSTAYASNTGADGSALPGYAQGVKVTYETDDSFYGLSVQDEAFDVDGDRLGGPKRDGDSSYAVELAAAHAFGDGFTGFIGGVYEDADEGDTYLLNTYVTYETGVWFFAGEVNVGNTENPGAWDLAFADESDDVDHLSGLLMANYAYSDVASVTGRFSYFEYDGGVIDQNLEFFKYTIAHNYAFTDNLLLVTEINYIDGDLDDLDDYEELVGAVELLFSF
ncbi:MULTISPECIES: outer membrane beta-barrel protein [unclassified Lentimonas]|uniref:outer membrane beta-barrel protein n=1 Tax=unclassified Lentimonas TaxID=2630993 RepID=UPI0013272D5E|nr:MULTISPECIES: outer membrane beta-barrel protein [unclassified Lentimonas]CAA6676621.1 Unannotated [Lentimonas sp. CC4]CAA6684716.1 Unannotated [Lentimonas sp. CC6]CAA7075352.1 Unannotated [Lentimonas sp. CC4]CAA7170960.1 Unannotated [Lentimonas sp. CC21]CAA7182239.1 Unannotated [Lentimonas sp. CC8]